MTINKEQLYLDLCKAYKKAKKGKGQKWYIKEFDKNLEENLRTLTDDIYNRRYNPQPFYVFVIRDPKVREIFAAEFRDRIVHHLYYEYVHKYFERTFIEDSYSCIKGKGTSYGIKRLRHHIESESLNYTRPCYVVKMDIKSYFININRTLLLNEVLRQLSRFNEKYPEKLDIPLLTYLSKVIILFDLTINAIPVGDKSLWKLVPKYKSLFTATQDCGLPLGNLTSQLFSNIYLNLLDQYVKRELHMKHYGRYVDDFYFVSKSKAELRRVIIKVSEFLNSNLYLEINKGKTILREVKYGVEFLGAFLKPYRTYISNQTLRRMFIKARERKNETKEHKIASSISRIGLLKHYRSFNIRMKLFYE